MLLALLPFAHAASLDNLEIGGPWGTPTATDATAAWWNPAGLAAGEGTRLMIEAAPTLATVTFQRADPNGGQDTYEMTGVVPYAGVATDLGVSGLGIGAALAVPFVRGGAEVEDPGSGSYHMRHGDQKGIYVLVGGGYDIADVVSIGVVGAYVKSTWTASVNTDTLPDLAHALEEEGQVVDYTDADLEDPNYAANLQFAELTDDAFTFGAGLRVQAGPDVAIGLAFHKGARVDNRGDVAIVFDCPPETDTAARYAAESRGLCYSTVNAQALVGYDLPSRVQLGVAVTPIEAVRLEAMVGWVGWAVFDDFDIEISGTGIEDEQTRQMLEKTQQWARANQNSVWGGVDAKVDVGERWTVGARALYDAAAVPSHAMSTNNYDANALMLSMLAAVRPVGPLQVSASWTHHILEERDVTDNGFSQTMEGPATEGRWNYPHANGVYGGRIDRFGLSARLAF